MTAIGVAAENHKVKACLPMDPWFFPYKDDFKLVTLRKTPMLAIKTETWYEWNGQAFDLKTPTEGFLKECDKKGNTQVVMITIKDTTHCYQTDFSVLMPFELHWIENLPRMLPRS